MLLICVFFILICLSFSTFNSFLCLESNKGKSSLSTINENLRIMGDEMIEGREVVCSSSSLRTSEIDERR